MVTNNSNCRAEDTLSCAQVKDPDDCRDNSPEDLGYSRVAMARGGHERLYPEQRKPRRRRAVRGRK